MFGLAASTWTVASVVFGLAGVLLLFYYGMLGNVQTGGRPIVTANRTPEAEAEERQYKALGYLGLTLTIASAVCAILAAYS